MPVPSTLSKNDLSSPFFGHIFLFALFFTVRNLHLLICFSTIFPRIYQAFLTACLLRHGIDFIPFYLHFFFLLFHFCKSHLLATNSYIYIYIHTYIYIYIYIYIYVYICCFQSAVACIIQNIDIVVN